MKTMSKIPTAEEFILDLDTEGLYCQGEVYSESGYTTSDTTKAMIEFAKLHVQQFKKAIASDIKTHDGFALSTERLEEIFSNHTLKIK